MRVYVVILNPKSETGSRLAVRGLGELGSLAGRFLDEEHLNELTSVLVECLAFVDVANNPAGKGLLVGMRVVNWVL